MKTIAIERNKRTIHFTPDAGRLRLEFIWIQAAFKALKGISVFGALLLLLGIAVIALLGYESITEMLYPKESILGNLHALGYLKDIPVVYDPGKGLWLIFGWTGLGMMCLMMLYSLRKRWSALSFGSMRRWLNVHMFLGIMGPVFITFHTTFKFHGLVATSFWCMAVTTVFGIIGRYIYVQIPRSITGAELDVKEIDGLVHGMNALINGCVKDFDAADLVNGITFPDEEIREAGAFKALLFMVRADIRNRFRVYGIRRELKRRRIFDAGTTERFLELLGRKAALIRKRNFLSASHRLLHYWHVLHIPLAIVMFVIVLLHICIYYIFSPS